MFKLLPGGRFNWDAFASCTDSSCKVNVMHFFATGTESSGKSDFSSDLVRLRSEKQGNN